MRIPRLARLQPADDGMLPVDIDAVKLRIRLQEICARLGEGLPSGIGCGHLVERPRVRPPANRHDELQVRMFLLQERDLMKQAVCAAGCPAVARIDTIHRRAGVHGEPVVGGNLAKRVVHVRQPGCRNVSERISLGRPVGVVTDDMEWGGGRRHRALRADATDAQRRKEREDERKSAHLGSSRYDTNRRASAATRQGCDGERSRANER